MNEGMIATDTVKTGISITGKNIFQLTLIAITAGALYLVYITNGFICAFLYLGHLLMLFIFFRLFPIFKKMGSCYLHKVIAVASCTFVLALGVKIIFFPSPQAAIYTSGKMFIIKEVQFVSPFVYDRPMIKLPSNFVEAEIVGEVPTNEKWSILVKYSFNESRTWLEKNEEELLTMLLDYGIFINSSLLSQSTNPKMAILRNLSKHYPFLIFEVSVTKNVMTIW